jgi:hypothetical protein
MLKRVCFIVLLASLVTVLSAWEARSAADSFVTAAAKGDLAEVKRLAANPEKADSELVQLQRRMSGILSFIRVEEGHPTVTPGATESTRVIYSYKEGGGKSVIYLDLEKAEGRASSISTWRR